MFVHKVDDVVSYVGNFPFVTGRLFRKFLSISKVGQSRKKLKEVALNIVKARRESQKQGKVYEKHF